MQEKIKGCYIINIGKYFYVGSSIHYLKRKRSHIQKLRKNTHANPIMQNLFNKGYEPKFHLFCKIDCPDTDIQKIEQLYLNELMQEKNCINICKRVGGGNLGCDYKKSGLKAAATRRKNGYYDKKIEFSQEHRDNLSKYMKKRTEENLELFTERIKAGQRKRWEEHDKNYIIIDETGKEYGPFRLLIEPERLNLISRKSMRELYTGQKEKIKGFRIKIL